MHTIRYIHHLILFAAFLAILSTSCKKELENINYDQKAIPDGPYLGGLMLSSMEKNILIINPAWQYQLQQNLNADIYSGYMATASAFAADINNTNYFMMDGWNGFISSVPFTVMNNWLIVRGITQKKFPELNAINTILKIIAFHRVADVHGPMPYLKYGDGNDVPFDGLDQMYYSFFSELTAATHVLDSIVIKNDANTLHNWEAYDVSSYAGDFKKWIKLSNTLRLRLAIRIAGVDAARAKTEAESAVNNTYGVLSDTEGPFTISCATPALNPLYTLNSVWGDCSLGAPVESYLKGYKDPRLAKFALPATDTDVAGEFKGIRNGIETPNSQLYRGYSHCAIGQNDGLIVMTAAEAYFLKAEGVLNGWNMGSGATAMSLYNAGIAASFKQWGTGDATAYLADNTSTAAPWVDTKKASNSVLAGDPNLSTITIQWNDADANDKKLERIITQKWIAMFPEGEEAWTEFRRTGYPKQFPVLINSSGGEIPNGKFIRRIPYPTSITSSSPVQSKAAISKYFNGHDGSYSPLWWMGATPKN